ncbi:MAG: hypothetical protein ACLRMZ_10710 [Blautia marasmi]
MNLAFSKDLYERGQSIWQRFSGEPEKMEDFVNLPGSLSQSVA